MRRIFQFLRERIFRMRLKRAIRKAETLRRMTGKKHLVVRWKNEPVVVSKQHQTCRVLSIETAIAPINKFDFKVARTPIIDSYCEI